MARTSSVRTATSGPRSIRCAVYTRKSTEDGLEQEFNSLDAQREACAAYVLSQRHEGWTLLPDQYDDGGYSGGTIERPGLQQLLAEVQAGRVDVIVVYKVDRLTRSLSDFARIVDILDAAEASFVSITQAFNTTTSMGRLTLNVLLSFAQFEREVTGERIRDKIAASKKKGMWMGGNVPLGYDVRDRKLIVNEPEAGQVRLIYERYVALGSVIALKEELAARHLYSKVRESRTGKMFGGVPFTHGALGHMLTNPIYLGLVRHNGTTYPGEHTAIVDQALFDQVAARFSRNRIDRRNGANVQDPSLLTGLLHDRFGRRMGPSHATKASRRYRYYISRLHEIDPDPRWRIPAGELESAILFRIGQAVDDHGILCRLIDGGISAEIGIRHLQRGIASVMATLRDGTGTERRTLLLEIVERIDIDDGRIAIAFNAPALMARIGASITLEEPVLTIDLPAHLIRAGREMRLVIPPSHRGDTTRHDQALIGLVVKAHAARAALNNASGQGLDAIAKAYGVTRDYFRVLIRLSYLAPDITAAIMEGRQPATLTRQMLARMPELPVEWNAQREALEFERP